MRDHRDLTWTSHRVKGAVGRPRSTSSTDHHRNPSRNAMSTSKEDNGSMTDPICAVCGERANGKFFGALVCLPCKSFFIRCSKAHESALPEHCDNSCSVTKHGRIRCQKCRYLKCLAAGMVRKEKPESVEPADGEILCLVCGDIANGTHFGIKTCEGCKKFFRRGLLENKSYVCTKKQACVINPRNRNNCRFCRYQKCVSSGMSRDAIKMGRPRKDRRQTKDVTKKRLPRRFHPVKTLNLNEIRGKEPKRQASRDDHHSSDQSFVDDRLDGPLTLKSLLTRSTHFRTKKEHHHGKGVLGHTEHMGMSPRKTFVTQIAEDNSSTFKNLSLLTPEKNPVRLHLDPLETRRFTTEELFRNSMTPQTAVLSPISVSVSTMHSSQPKESTSLPPAILIHRIPSSSFLSPESESQLPGTSSSSMSLGSSSLSSGCSLSPKPWSWSPGASSLSPGSSALSPTSSALSPGSSALSPGSSSLSPGSSALSPGSSALSPGSLAMSPGSSALSPGHSTMSPGHSTMSPRSLALSPGSSVLSPGSSAQSTVPSALSPGSSVLSTGSSAFSPGSLASSPGSSTVSHGSSALSHGSSLLSHLSAVSTGSSQLSPTSSSLSLRPSSPLAAAMSAKLDPDVPEAALSTTEIEHMLTFLTSGDVNEHGYLHELQTTYLNHIGSVDDYVMKTHADDMATMGKTRDPVPVSQNSNANRLQSALNVIHGAREGVDYLESKYYTDQNNNTDADNMGEVSGVNAITGRMDCLSNQTYKDQHNAETNNANVMHMDKSVQVKLEKCPNTCSYHGALQEKAKLFDHHHHHNENESINMKTEMKKRLLKDESIKPCCHKKHAYTFDHVISAIESFENCSIMSSEDTYIPNSYPDNYGVADSRIEGKNRNLFHGQTQWPTSHGQDQVRMTHVHENKDYANIIDLTLELIHDAAQTYAMDIT